MKRSNCFVSLLVAVALLITMLGPVSGFAQENDLRQGALYTQTDGTLGNRVIAFYRHENGTLEEAGRFATGGLGLGTHLISAGSVTLTERNGAQFLYVTNSLSNNITVFSVGKSALTRVQVIPSSGLRPIGVTVYEDLLYVVHEISGTIVGFSVGNDGRLTKIPGSQRGVTGGTVSEPFQVLFNNDGTVLAVSDQNTNIIDTWTVDLSTGLPSEQATANYAYGLNPFGMAFDQYGRLFSTAGGFDLPLFSSMTSFDVGAGGVLSPISPMVGNGRQFECWVLVTSGSGFSGGQFAYTNNTGDSTVSSYFVFADGRITLLDSVAGTAASFPLIGIVDNAMTSDSKYYYAASLTGFINAWKIEDNGDLTPLQTISGLPLNIAGLAVR